MDLQRIARSPIMEKESQPMQVVSMRLLHRRVVGCSGRVFEDDLAVPVTTTKLTSSYLT